MRILSTSTVAALLATPLLLAACSDATTTAPERAAAAPLAPRLAIYVDRLDTTSAVKSADITVTPGGGWFQLGKHGVYFPANSICDPTRSSYGVTEWDESCRTIRKPIKIHAELDTKSSSWIVFTPDLRFRPTSDEGSWVYLFMYTAELEGRLAAQDEIDGKWNIEWLPGGGLPAVDESIADKTLKTRQYKSTGYVFRRVKHFSGYQVALGTKDRSLMDGGSTDSTATSSDW